MYSSMQIQFYFIKMQLKFSYIYEKLFIKQSKIIFSWNKIKFVSKDNVEIIRFDTNKNFVE